MAESLGRLLVVIVVYIHFVVARLTTVKRACVEFNAQYIRVRTFYSRVSRAMRAGYKRGMVRLEVLCHAHNMAAKFKLCKRSSTNSTITHSTVYDRRNVTDDYTAQCLP